MRKSAPRNRADCAVCIKLLCDRQQTVVELLDDAYEVEFSDDEGRTYAELALPSDQLLVLYHRPQQAP